MTAESTPIDTERAVRERYAAAAKVREAALCCPVEYDARYLEAIPAEVIERDYGCGDPSRHVRAGDVVLDLGSGGGKICFIASQIVGKEGRVIGVDVNAEMLALARESAPRVAAHVGYANVEFRRARIQDLALDLVARTRGWRSIPCAAAKISPASRPSRSGCAARRPSCPTPRWTWWSRTACSTWCASRTSAP